MADTPTVLTDSVHAAVDLVGRTGASHLEFGFLYDNVPSEEADWWASAHYQGARVTAEHHTGPVEAIENLAMRLLDGAKCKRCGSPVSLVEPPFPTDCHWSRQGDRWIPGCGPPPPRSSPLGSPPTPA